ncbi:MAG: serine/threonine protein kinase [Porticoccaceae bacterium]
MTSSSEFQLPAGDTHSEGDPGGGDSTLDLPDMEALKAGKIRSPNPGSTVFDNKPAKLRNRTASESEIRRLGDFRIKEAIGEGSMGEVFLAEQSSLGRKVALKLLPKEFAPNETLRERFLREAKSLASLDHPHIVRVYAMGEEAGHHYAAMEFIDGASLQDIIDQKKRLSVGDAVQITLVCATALEHAHNQGIIHRDIKPANILVSRDGMAKVADFGLVKLVQADMSMTATGTGLGTPEYMAPEQSYDARTATPASDVFSLGAMLYVMLTGELPYKGKSVVELLTAKQSGKYAPAKSLNPEVPERLDLIIHRTLVPEPKQRYACCSELIRDLSTLSRHNDSLSFCDSKTPYVAYGAWSKTANSSGATASAVSSATTSPASRSTGQKSPASQRDASPTPGADSAAKMWYVSHKNKLGKQVLSKMMTDELILALERKLLPPTAQVKSAQNQPFRPLGDHSEFHPVLGRLGVPIRKSPAAQQKSTGQKKKRRKKKLSETTDLTLRVVVGLCAAYGLVRGLMDVAGIFQDEPPPTVEESKEPNPGSLL